MNIFFNNSPVFLLAYGLTLGSDADQRCVLVFTNIPANSVPGYTERIIEDQRRLIQAVFKPDHFLDAFHLACLRPTPEIRKQYPKLLSQLNELIPKGEIPRVYICRTDELSVDIARHFYFPHEVCYVEHGLADTLPGPRIATTFRNRIKRLVRGEYFRAEATRQPHEYSLLKRRVNDYVAAYTDLNRPRVEGPEPEVIRGRMSAAWSRMAPLLTDDDRRWIEEMSSRKNICWIFLQAIHADLEAGPLSSTADHVLDIFFKNLYEHLGRTWTLVFKSHPRMGETERERWIQKARAVGFEVLLLPQDMEFIPMEVLWAGGFSGQTIASFFSSCGFYIHEWYGERLISGLTILNQAIPSNHPWRQTLAPLVEMFPEVEFL